MVRDKSYYKPHRAQRKAIERVQETQADQRGEGTIWKGPESANRHERRRFRKAVRRYDKQNGEGAAEELVRSRCAEDDPLVGDAIKPRD